MRAEVKKSMPAQQKVPARLTASPGTQYENPLATWFLLDMLAGLISVGPDFGRRLFIRSVTRRTELRNLSIFC